MQVWSLGWKDPLKEEMATHSSILVWKIPLTEEPGRLKSMGSQRVGHNWSDLGPVTCTHSFYFRMFDFLFSFLLYSVFMKKKNSFLLAMADSFHTCILSSHLFPLPLYDPSWMHFQTFPFSWVLLFWGQVCTCLLYHKIPSFNPTTYSSNSFIYLPYQIS